MYDAKGAAYGFFYNGDLYFYIRNLQGDVVGITDSAGTVLGTYVYDAWGNLIESASNISNSIASMNPLRYRGYYYDTETGFYFLNSRYYNPRTGRFLNADGYVSTNATILGFNMFAYCYDNPITYVDSGGSRPIVGDWPKETKEEHTTSFAYMQGTNYSQNNLSSSQTDNSETVAFDKFLQNWSNEANNVIQKMTNAFYVEGGLGFGLGGSTKLDFVEVGAQIYFNPINVKMTNNGTELYASFYMGIPFSIGTYEENLEWHYQIGWDDILDGNITAWRDVSETGGRIGDRGISVTYYSPKTYFFGGNFFIGFDSEVFIP